MVRLLFALLLTTLYCTGGRAQSSEGTDFWFSFLQHRDPENSMVALISAREATSGTLNIPGTGWSQDFMLGANEVRQIALPRAAETLGSEVVRGSAVHLVSALPVSLYIHQFFSMRSEASLVLPTAVLGRNYLVMAYTGRAAEDANYPSAFVVVASQDGTEISMEGLRAATENGRAQGADITVSLDRGESYQVRARNAAGDLTGTRVRASAPVAVFAGAAWSGVPANCGVYDNLLEINYPISQWGREYFGVPTLNNSTNVYRILAAEDGTTVDVEGQSDFSRSLDAGEFAEFSTGSAVRITSNRPVLVAEYLLGRDCNGHPQNGIGDPSFFLLNDASQTIDNVTVFNSSLQDITENYLNILFRTGDEGSILLDGAAVNAPLELAPGGEYGFYRVRVTAGNHTITSAGCGVIVTVYGYGTVESYSYGGGAGFREINVNPIVEGGCRDEAILFDTGLDPLRFAHEWTLDDGSVVNEVAFTRSYDQVGDYPISLIITDECLGVSDTSFREISITLRAAATVPDNAFVCVGDSLDLRAVDLPGASYAWVGPNDFTQMGQRLIVPAAGLDQAGVYSVTGDVSGCLTVPADVAVTVNPTPLPAFSGDTVYCGRTLSAPFIEAGASFTEYAWSDGRVDNPRPVVSPGTYAVTVTDDNGCVAADSITVREFCPTRTYIPSAFSPNDDGVNDVFGIFAVDFTGFSLRVYDRWGGLVFNSTTENPGWDGTVNGRAAPVGTYLYEAVVRGLGDDGELVLRRRAGVVVLVR